MLTSDLIPRSLKCAWEEKPNALDLVLSQSVHDECNIPQCAVCDQRQDFLVLTSQTGITNGPDPKLPIRYSLRLRWRFISSRLREDTPARGGKRRERITRAGVPIIMQTFTLRV